MKVPVPQGDGSVVCGMLASGTAEVTGMLAVMRADNQALAVLLVVVRGNEEER